MFWNRFSLVKILKEINKALYLKYTYINKENKLAQKQVVFYTQIPKLKSYRVLKIKDLN